jgi:hypothetical protein
MRLRLLASLLLASTAACGGGGGGPTFTPPYVEAKEPRLACPPPVQLVGINSAPDPGPTCQLAPQSSALDAAHGLLDLGDWKVGQEPNFQVPAGTAGLTIIEQLVLGGPPDHLVTTEYLPRKVPPDLVTSDNVAVIGELHDPDGLLVYTDLTVVDPTADLTGELLVTLGTGAVAGTVTYPSSTGGLSAVGLGGVAPGTWRVMVNDYGYECALALSATPPPGLAGAITCPQGWSDTVYRVYVLLTPGATSGTPIIRPAGGLDLAIHLVDAPTPLFDVKAAGALTDARMQRMIQSYAGFLSGAGICLGTVTYYDAPDWARLRYAEHVSSSDPTPCGNLPQLLATSRPGDRTLELFLLPKLLQDPASTTGTVVGVDGTIPGPATVNGTVASGAVVSAEDLGWGSCPAAGGDPTPRPYTCGADEVAYVAAHESGHFLGLYHPTDSGGIVFDPLRDTPHCECTKCGLAQATCDKTGLPGTRCTHASATCGGGANLMFWLVSSVSQGYLSPEQARIARSSPLVSSP